MSDLNGIILTEVNKPVIVHLQKGHQATTANRTSYGLSFCLRGQITYCMDGKKTVSTRENAVILPKGATYRYECDKDGVFYVVNFQCNGFECDAIKAVTPENTQSCIKSAEHIRQLFSQKEGRLAIFSATFDLLSKTATIGNKEKNPISQAATFIADNLQDAQLCNTRIAEEMGISEVYLRKLFLARYGTTPRQFILEMRINKAKELLCDTTLSVADIAEHCGFASIYHFCRIFKQRVGVTPTQYGAENRFFGM